MFRSFRRKSKSFNESASTCNEDTVNELIPPVIEESTQEEGSGFEAHWKKVEQGPIVMKQEQAKLPQVSKSQLHQLRRPPVYEEATAMLAGSLLIYWIAELRDMAREGEIDKTLLEPPITTEQVLESIQDNREALEKRALNHEDLKLRLDAISSTINSNHKEKYDDANGFLQRLQLSLSLSRKDSVSSRNCKTTVTHFMDSKAHEEIVHAIIVNEALRRVTIIFRGSVTQKDFQQDAKCAQTKMDMPIPALQEAGDVNSIRIHSGFHEYLFRVNKETGETRFQEILRDVKELLREYPGFHFYSCGHSLGGALCTLFGFFAAADDELYTLLQSPVIVYSIASPYVGNWKFRFAFQHLERHKRLQHLRIANLEDMVTLLPFATPSLAVLSPALTLIKGSAGNLYKHTGIRLQMTKQHICTISYPKDQDASSDEEKMKEIQDALNSGKSLTQSLYHLFRQDVDRIVMYHSCEEYETRLEKCKSEMMKVTLDDIYSNKDIVGDVLDLDYVPRTQPSSYERTKMALKYWKNTQSSTSTNALVAN